MRMFLALAAAAFAVLATGCAIDTTRATDITSSSATLHGDVRCTPGTSGTAWWEIRKAGAPTWQLASARHKVSCPNANPFTVSQNVSGLRAGVRYGYRLAGDPGAVGGPVSYSSDTWLTTRRFSPGLVSSANHPLSAAAARSLGADVVRVEFEIGTPVSSMRSSVAAIADAGARPLLLAGFEGRLPTQAETQNLARWAAEFGPGGSFWAGRPDGRLAVQQIEFGNETSYSYQYGDTWSDQSYASRAEGYAIRLAQARMAIGATGRDVGLLAQADDGGSGSSAWVDHMFRAVPNLDELVDGWTVHPYGPRTGWKPKTDRLIMQTGAHGASSRIPIDITEYGLSSDDGAALTHNYGWSPAQTYAQAASALNGTIAAMRADPALGPRLRLFTIYAAHDLQPSGATNQREDYFGALQNDLGAKGAYTAEVRSEFAR